MTSAIFKVSDVCDDTGYFAMFGDFLTNYPDKISGFASEGLRLKGQHDLAERCEVVSSFTAALSASKGVIELSQALWGLEVRNAVYHAANLVSDFVNGIKFFETSKRIISLPERLVLAAPFCEMGVCVVDIYHGIRELTAKDEGDAQYCALRNKERKWSLTRNVMLGGVSALGFAGVVISANFLFATSIAALLSTMFAFFAKQELKEYAIENKTLTSSK